MPPTSQRTPRASRHVAPSAALLLLGALAACDRTPAARPADSTIPAPAPPPPDSAPAAAAPTTTWDGEAGLALVVPGEQGDARVVVPGTGAGSPADTATGAADAALPNEVLLLSRAGAACAASPPARLGPASGADVAPEWTVGLVQLASGAPAVTAVPVDSLHGLASADSATLAAAVTRLASALPVDSSARALRGLPFVVRAASRFRADTTTLAVVAVLTRALPQEANPIGEFLLLVAERPAAATGAAASRWTLAYHERAAGREEALPAAELLAALREEAERRPAVLVARAAEEGNRYSLLERAAPGRWTVRWTSVAAGGC
ncbi:hypothetical protein [Roseisolibacter sp. H3M3-2]|uniref:hypothetical protein n=1 Tax=Roseisolibacter sp. H3M3-2 TaxID=3031323 RepID=UPI0023DBE76B|nr:hypothetical protein [Roseisolibacter sp. H3M3-2]MDF1504155.1 hypothetical protein [Roseisolibacter sp. H3M3-2]